MRYLSVLFATMIISSNSLTETVHVDEPIKSSCSKLYSPKMPEIYPDKHFNNLCLNLNGTYKVTVSMDPTGEEGHGGYYTLNFFTDLTTLPNKYKFENHFYHSGYQSIDQAGDGQIRWSSNGIGEGIYCDSDGTSFITVSLKNGEPTIFSHVRFAPGKQSNELIFLECNSGFMGHYGVLTKSTTP